MTVLLLVLIAVIGYTVGCANGAIIVSKWLFKKDVRNYGSHNAGLTNFYRTFGVPGTTLVLLIDVAKAAVAVLLGGLLMTSAGYPVVGRIFAGFCVMLGHAYPVLYSFRGGKCVLSGSVIVFCVDWRVGVACVLVFLVVVIFTKYVSLGSMIGAIFFPIGVWSLGYGGLEGVLAFLCLLLLVYRHAGNIKRLTAGNERKVQLGRNAAHKLDEDF